MKTFGRACRLGACLALALGFANAQNLENIGRESPVKATGGVNMTAVGYGASGIPARREALDWFLDGSFSLSLFGWSVPFSFRYSDQQATYRQPFNQYGVSPEYKWVRARLGYGGMRHSRYGLSNHVFLGGGVELSPGKFRLSAMHGRLNKAVRPDSVGGAAIRPVYKRMGFGLKAGIEESGHALHAAVFRAWDDKRSLPSAGLSEPLEAKENTVLSIIGRKRLAKRLSVDAEYAASLLTADNGAAKNEARFGAFRGAVSYAVGAHTLGAAYERVAPGYETLGAYFFNDDLENITLDGAFQLFAGKATVSANAGRQRNNLGDTEGTATSRGVASVNATLAPGPKWNFSGSFSNFATHTNARPRYGQTANDELDSLNFYQVSRNATGSAAYAFGGKEYRQGVTLNASFQTASEESGGRGGTASDFFTASAAYRLGVKSAGLSVAAMLNASRIESAGLESTTLGPAATLNKSWLDKTLRCGLAGAYNHRNDVGGPSSRIVNVRLNATYAPRAKGENSQKQDKTGNHRFTLNVAGTRNFGGGGASAFSEVTATAGYQYSFKP